MKEIMIDPVTRIEGHLKFTVYTENGVVRDARSSGTLFRGFEIILRGKEPRDALRITPRICGVCPVCHGIASAKALDDAFGAEIPDNAKLVRNIILGANTVMSHAAHFYALWGPDLVNEKYSAHPAYPELQKRFAPLAGSSYLGAVRARTIPHEIIAIFGGKMPHMVCQVPGGVTCTPSLSDITKALVLLMRVKDFVEGTVLGGSVERWLENRSLSDVQKWMGENGHAESDLGLLIRYGPELGLDKIGAGCGKFVSYGIYEEPGGGTWLKSGLYDGEFHAFDQGKISEHVRHSWYRDYEGGKHPSDGATEPQYDKEEGYSWLKSPRYDGQVTEVGPLARMICDQDPLVLDLAKALGPNVYTRTLARLHETVRLIPKINEWLNAIDPAKPFCVKSTVPRSATGAGLTEAPRGALGHWVRIEKGRIANYQVITPTAWNGSPRDAAGNPGPMEQAVIGAPVSDEANLVEVQHIIRSFDPCLACAIHVLDANGRESVTP